MLRASRAEVAARRDAAAASQISDFLVNLFAMSNTDAKSAGTTTVREALDSGAESLLVRVIPPVRELFGPNSTRTSLMLVNLGPGVRGTAPLEGSRGQSPSGHRHRRTRT